ncbi:MAG TPA: DcaP family trimeric outer membrane transporter [Gemmatimonadaceae bacterium]
MKTSRFVALLLATLPATLFAQTETKITVYGFTMMDAGYNANQIHPDWYDVIRDTKLPSFKNEFGPNGNTYFSARQSRLGVKGLIPTDLGELKTTFEFEMFGTGVDAGQTTIRLRHAYGELGQFGAGQYWSPFMDIDVFPNTVEYWGPPGMAFFRNVQVRYMPIQGNTRLTFALERPGASRDGGVYADRIELADVKPRFPLPDLSAEYRYSPSKWGYVELAGIYRRIEWKDQGQQAFDLSGGVSGWGVNLSSNVNVGKADILRLQALYGEGIENYMNDAPADVGLKRNTGNVNAPVEGEAIPVSGFVGFLDHTWNPQFTSSVGYSSVNITNSELDAPSAFRRGQYAIGNVLWTPVPGVMSGVELQWGNRHNFSDGFKSDIFKIQFSFKYNFSKTF